eukprot:4732255-Prymnesium_polylepis.1
MALGTVGEALPADVPLAAARRLPACACGRARLHTASLLPHACALARARAPHRFSRKCPFFSPVPLCATRTGSAPRASAPDETAATPRAQ